MPTPDASAAGDGSEPFRPAALPRIAPLRDTIYRDPSTAESALKLLRPEYRLTKFIARDEMTILADLCERTLIGDRTGTAANATTYEPRVDSSRLIRGRARHEPVARRERSR